MDEKSYVVRIPRRWARIALVVLVTALIVAPVTAFASHSFTDVPDTNIFHGDIEWMADAGVTKGCNPPANTQFCPKDAVTRETLSAFMHRLAVNQVVDADKVDGKDGEAYTNPAVNDLNNDVTLTAGVTTNELAELSITTPSSSGVVIWATVLPNDQTIASFATIWLQVDNTTCTFDVPNFFGTMWGRVGTGSGAASSTIQGAEPVAAGNHTVTLCGNNFIGATFDADISLTAMFATDVSSSGSLASADTGTVDGGPGTP